LVVTAPLKLAPPESTALCHALAKSLRDAAEDVERAAEGEPLRIGSALARLEDLKPRLTGLAKALVREGDERRRLA
jgi:hypothetical protein